MYIYIHILKCMRHVMNKNIIIFLDNINDYNYIIIINIIIVNIIIYININCEK